VVVVTEMLRTAPQKGRTRSVVVDTRCSDSDSGHVLTAAGYGALCCACAHMQSSGSTIVHLCHCSDAAWACALVEITACIGLRKWHLARYRHRWRLREPSVNG
jgi:hypothetical protein